MHLIQGDELRALRRLQREQPPSPNVFRSERGSPIGRAHTDTQHVRIGGFLAHRSPGYDETEIQSGTVAAMLPLSRTDHGNIR